MMCHDVSWCVMMCHRSIFAWEFHRILTSLLTWMRDHFIFDENLLRSTNSLLVPSIEDAQKKVMSLYFWLSWHQKPPPVAFLTNFAVVTSSWKLHEPVVVVDMTLVEWRIVHWPWIWWTRWFASHRHLRNRRIISTCDWSSFPHGTELQVHFVSEGSCRCAWLNLL
jgi:hypothetical protein